MNIEEARLEKYHNELNRMFIDEDDLFLDWEDFKKKYPDITKEEYELVVKQFQEV